ncbi:hypothetical protein HOG17_00060 [Candidatus Peregrinibacteria bacterium]|jgi:hypothetical protein|nr:hypothetical protein [Candidatus Peregrinibacteria bacterium]MBT4147654.1 hypothetical protein [Candidatus Peregrinibacteria bacterium]MBT4366290.1 hypothetical protein [Candidatus Peregrinibacteria bacterium]MBT4456256.1 hypothetical protein [Candidatus Peregrinibacteria bacterium]
MSGFATPNIDHSLPPIQHSVPAQERAPQHFPFGDERAGKQGKKGKDPNDLITTPPAPAVSKVVTVHDRIGQVGFTLPEGQGKPPCADASCRAIKEKARSALHPGNRGENGVKKAQKKPQPTSIRKEKFPGSDKILENVHGEIGTLNGQLKSPVKAEEITRIIQKQIRRWYKKDGVREDHIQHAVEVNMGESIEMVVERSLKRIEVMIRTELQRAFRAERRAESARKRQISPLDKQELLMEAKLQLIRQTVQEQEREHTEETLSRRMSQGKTAQERRSEKADLKRLTARYPEAISQEHAIQIEAKERETLNSRHPESNPRYEDLLKTKRAVAREADLKARYPEFYEEASSVANEEEQTEPETARGTIRYERVPRKTTKINLS